MHGNSKRPLFPGLRFVVTVTKAGTPCSHEFADLFARLNRAILNQLSNLTDLHQPATLPHLNLPTMWLLPAFRNIMQFQKLNSFMYNLLASISLSSILP